MMAGSKVLSFYSFCTGHLPKRGGEFIRGGKVDLHSTGRGGGVHRARTSTVILLALLGFQQNGSLSEPILGRVHPTFPPTTPAHLWFSQVAHRRPRFSFGFLRFLSRYLDFPVVFLFLFVPRKLFFPLVLLGISPETFMFLRFSQGFWSHISAGILRVIFGRPTQPLRPEPAMVYFCFFDP